MKRLRLVIMFSSLALVALTVSCGSGDDPAGSGTTVTSAPTPATTSNPSTPSATTTTAGGTGAGDRDVRVYFAREERVATAGRTVSPPAVGGAAMVELLAGPDDFESGIGMGTEIPDGTRLNGLAIVDGIATVDLSAEFESGGGSLSMQVRVAQVVFTLTQFESVDEVTVHLDGEAVEAIGGEGIDATELTRDDFTDVTPFILVESPTPGETVSSPLEVSGIANTFEANVQFSVTDADGGVLDEGFTTATAGNGTWGDFSFTADFTAAGSGLGTVVAFQESAEDGSRRDVYEVPVPLG